ncbi:MAG: polyprenyl synthetase family protein [Muribaculaceae bacterium]|nr:polyprenyl synthetase family protein [Muribaculaceae bacterium]
MKSFDEYLHIINGAIAGLEYPASPANLYEPIKYTMSLGGKRLRPVLTLMTCEAMGGDIKKALNPALAVEMLHNSTLLHDDVMDNADVRRGKPTVHRKWNENVAIQGGDAMLAIASGMATRVDSDILPEVLGIFSKTALEIFEGQQFDMDFEERDDVSVSEYIDMIRLKTSVLLGCAMKIGALAAHASAADCDAMYHVGESMGLAFQLQDDFLDVWGNEATFGKEIGGDIMNNKKTFLLTSALNMARGKDAEELHHWLDAANASRQQKVDAVTNIYERLGIKSLARDEIDRYSTQAKQLLRGTNIDAPSRETFENLIDKLTTRSE